MVGDRPDIPRSVIQNKGIAYNPIYILPRCDPKCSSSGLIKTPIGNALTKPAFYLAV